MIEVTTTAGELRMGDQVRFPEVRGGHRWETVSRALVAAAGQVELLFAGGYRTLPAARVVVRRPRAGEVV